MIIDNISLLNVRKINQSHISFIENTNIIVGKNGEGKTTILEAIYFLLTTKSFRKKANQNIIKKQQKQLQIQATTTKETKTKIKLIYNGKTKNYAENNTPTSKTSKILKKNNVVAVSPEEINPIEAYRSERVGYFDKILFKSDPDYMKSVQKYNKLITLRNTSLQIGKNEKIWDKAIAEEGLKIWKKKDTFFDDIIIKIKSIQQSIKTEKKYTIKYKTKKTSTHTGYIEELIKTTKNEKTNFGPHKDKINYFQDGAGIKDQSSQGEKKLFIYILKLAEAEYLFEKKKDKPILLLDDFSAKLDSKNIMKIFTYFHRKFQTIITTTKEENIELPEAFIKNQSRAIKTIKINDKIK